MNESSFLGCNFTPVRLEDAGHFSSILGRHPHPLAGYTFATLEAWKPFYHYCWCAASSDSMLISWKQGHDSFRHLLQPVGPLTEEMKDRLLRQVAELDYSLKIIGVCSRFLDENPDFVRLFSVREERDFFNYVYSAAALAKLSGRKYSKKRNLIAQAQNLYQWTLHPLTAALAQDCFAVLASIMEEEHPIIEGMLKRELSALETTLHKFDLLRQQGLLISVAGRPAAFSIFEPISPNTMAIHFERALRSYKGLYQVVNWEAAKIIHAQGFEYINREEDLGDPGLRDAKMSYQPVELVPSYELTFRRS